ncbi:transporter substrate-binding domain-containing protein [Crossiella sp. SN42]|uniref:transporter substrate-binding domain-containing protein n=1 Tax=Crossiella sp. SN42 TaxID=2944808 RepID=UPI00207D0B63|nr:transporter substrate-binding domain-containing protein [Crossiella sp. SN42]MCO1582671.1 transporter substrate-binding domain-containing protein [Crossiella sp. SN42]
MQRIAIVALTGLLVLTACGGEDPAPGGTGSPGTSVSIPPSSEQASGSPTIDKIKARGRMVVGVADNLPGVSKYHQDGGKHSGFDIKLAEVIATGLGLPKDSVRFRSTTEATRLSTLESGDVDLAFGGIKASTQPQIGLVGPYLPVHQDLLVRKGTSSVASGQPVCVAANTSAAAKAETVTSRVISERNGDTCVAALRAGTVTAFSGDDLVLRGYAAEEKGGFTVLGRELTSEGYFIGIPARDRALRAKLAEILTKAMADGSWAKLFQESFGVPAPTPPSVK